MSTDRPTREIVTQVMLRLTPEDYGILQTIGQPGEPMAHTYLRVARASVLPPTILLRYRKAPLFPAWMTMGPLSPLDADARGQRLIGQRFEVEVVEVGGTMPQAMWPEDLQEEEEDE